MEGRYGFILTKLNAYNLPSPFRGGAGGGVHFPNLEFESESFSQKD